MNFQRSVVRNVFQGTVFLSSTFCINAILFAASPGVETFDLDAGSFVGNTTSSVVVYIPIDGNPGGHIETRKSLTPPVFDIGALTDGPGFTGDYAAAGIQRASVDLLFLTDNIEDAWLRFRKDDVSNGWRYPLTNDFTTGVWDSYSVTFDPTWSDVDAKAQGWLTDMDVDINADPSLPFADVFASVGTAEVRLASQGRTLAGIDNFAIDVPEPTGFALLFVAMVLTAVTGLRAQL